MNISVLFTHTVTHIFMKHQPTQSADVVFHNRDGWRKVYAKRDIEARRQEDEVRLSCLSCLHTRVLAISLDEVMCACPLDTTRWFSQTAA
jgi:hypothetical protein